MSVLIKGVNMPKFCGVNECPLCSLGWREKNRYTEWCHRPNGGGFVMVGYHGEENKIPDDCPLLEVSTPHGRLIDSDPLKEQCGDWYIEEGTEVGFIGSLCTLLDEAPTVIEAEE